MGKPLVSIIVPVYQRFNLSCEAIESALKQTYENIEIIVGDNHSTDATYEKLRTRFSGNSKVILFQNNTNLGAVGNWQECLKRAKGTYIKFLWSDDLMHASFIEKGVQILESNPKISFVYSSVLFFNEINDEVFSKAESVRYRFGDTGIYPGQMFMDMHFLKTGKVAPVSPGCALFRKDKLLIHDDIPNGMGYIHKKNGAGIDLLIFLEAIAKGENFAYIDEPLNYFREHEESISVFDPTIYIGYNTAKVYFMTKYAFKQYYSDLMTEIMANAPIKVLLSKRKKEAYLKKYLDNESVVLNEEEIKRTIWNRIKKRVLKGV